MNAPKPQKIEVYDWDFGQCGQWCIDVELYYTPAERATRDDPGCDEEFDIVSITYKGNDISCLFESDETMDELIKAIKEYYND